MSAPNIFFETKTEIGVWHVCCRRRLQAALHFTPEKYQTMFILYIISENQLLHTSMVSFLFALVFYHFSFKKTYWKLIFYSFWSVAGISHFQNCWTDSIYWLLINKKEGLQAEYITLQKNAIMVILQMKGEDDYFTQKQVWYTLLAEETYYESWVSNVEEINSSDRPRKELN